MAAAVSTAPSATAPGSSRPWLFSAAVDLLVGCGAWSLPLLAVTFFFQRQSSVGTALAFYLLALVCNQPHYMATIYRAYHTTEDFNRYRFFTVYVTALALLTAAIAHLLPDLLPWLITIYLSWSPWHYSSQNFGIAQMLTRRADPAAPPDPAARRLLYASYVASFAVWLLTLHTARATSDPDFLSLRLPVGLTTPLQILGTLIFFGCAGAAFLRLARGRSWRSLVPALTLTLTQLCWFVAPALLVRFGGLALPASYFSAGALAFMHCAQYLWITGYYARQEAGLAESAPMETPAKSRARRFSLPRYYLALVVGGIALFLPGPWLASRVLGHDFVESFLIFTALVNLHHFILDGAIWKLRESRIARFLIGRQPSASAAPSAPASSAGRRVWLFGPVPAAQWTRRTLAVGLLALAALDQWQHYATSHAADAATLARASAINPHDPRPVFRRAQLAAGTSDWPTARHELEGLLAANPRDAPAQLLLGEVLLGAGDTTAALSHYDRLFALYPNDLGVALNRGLAAADQHQWAQGVASYERAVSLAPDDVPAQAGLAAALAEMGATTRAIAEYEEVFRLCEARVEPDDLPGYLDASLRQADLLAAAGDAASLQRAAQRLKRAADIAATQHLFPVAAAALQRLATVQDQLHLPAEAAVTRATAAQTESLIQ